MKYNLFIDDERFPPVTVDSLFASDPLPWLIVRSSAEAIAIHMNYGCPEFIAFDHDLGGEDTSIRYINWFINQVIDSIDRGIHPSVIKIPEYSIHSQNTPGAENIDGKLKSLIKFLRGQDARLSINERVTFHPKVFFPPYAPHYDSYLGHTFIVSELHPEDLDGHIKVSCLDDPKIDVAGYVHSSVLVKATE